MSKARNIVENTRVLEDTKEELGYMDGVTNNVQTQLGEKVSKSGDTMTGNFGIGITPSAWGSINNVMQIGVGSSFVGRVDGYGTEIETNAYRDSGNTYRYIGASQASIYSQAGGAHYWSTAPTGTGNGAIPWVGVMELNALGSLLLTSGTGGLGYGTGSGGTVTQVTSKSTAVTLNKPSGQIVMNNASLVASGTVAFRFNNSLIDAYSVVKLSIVYSAASEYVSYYICEGATWNGFTYVYIKNIGGATLSEALVINFVIIKGSIN